VKCPDTPGRFSGESSGVGSYGSKLSVEASEEGNWLLYTPATPATLRRLESMVVLGCLALAELALDQDFAARDTHVRINDGGPWLTVHGPGANNPPNEFDYDTLLVPKELTVERFAKWIPFNDTLDGLGSVAARPIEAPLQTQVLVVTSLVEGLHRRLDKIFEQSKFPNASKSALGGIEQAARRAARVKAEGKRNLDPQQVHEAVMHAVSHFEQVDYVERAKDVVKKVCGVLPEIAESVADLPERITKARNEMAHQLLLNEETEPLEIRYLRWLVVASVTPWLLRGLLLLEELLLARGVVVTYETIRSWCAKFGPDYANQLRGRRPRPGDKWHLDEVFVKINGTTHYLWRAVDQHGDVLDILVQSRRNAVAAKRFFRCVQRVGD